MGIFGSSTPEDPAENKRVEQISKDWVPMLLGEQKAFPMEYVMFCEDRYIAGGTTSCSSLIQGDHHPNIWTHVLVPEKSGEESFLACLAVTSFDKEKKRKDKICLKRLTLEYDDGIELRHMLKSWEDECTDAYFLKQILLGLSGAKKVLITDQDLAEDDFESYQVLSREVMCHIYHMFPGCWRKELNFIAPMVPKYCMLSSKKPKGARFYFGPEDSTEQYDQVISMQQGRELNSQCFYDDILIQMSELFHEHSELYEEIGENFQKKHFSVNENDYVWHFVFEMAERDIPVNWKKFGIDEYQEAYNQVWMDEEKRRGFLTITAILLEQKESFCLSSEFFSVYCRMLRAFSCEMDLSVWEKLIHQTVEWMMQAEENGVEQLEEYLKILLETGIREDIEYKIQNAVMQKSPGLQKKAETILEHTVSSEEMELWWTAYAPLREQFMDSVIQKLLDLFTGTGDEEEKNKLLVLDKTISGGEARKELTNRLRKLLNTVSFDNMQNWELWKAGREELAMLAPKEYQKKEKEWQDEFLKEINGKNSDFLQIQEQEIRDIASDLKLDWEKIQRKIEKGEMNHRKNETCIASDEELLELLLSVNQSQNQEEYHFVLDNIASRIFESESLKDEVQFNLFCYYYICYPDADKEKKDKFWHLCTLKWFPELEKLLRDPAAQILNEVLDYENMPFEGRLFFLYHSSMKEPLEDARKAMRRQLKSFSEPEREAAKNRFLQEEIEVRRILLQELNQSNRNQMLENIWQIIKSAFCAALLLLIYEGMIQVYQMHQIAAAVTWLVIIFGCLTALLLSLKKKKPAIHDKILLLGGILWISCGAVVKVLCGIGGSVIYFAVLLIVSFVVLLISGHQAR